MKLAKIVILMCEESNNTAIGGKYVVPFAKVYNHIDLLVSYLKFIDADKNLIQEVSDFAKSIDFSVLPKLEEDELIKILKPMQPMWLNVVTYLEKNHDKLKGTIRLGRTKIEPDKLVASVAREIKKMMIELKNQGFDVNKMRVLQ